MPIIIVNTRAAGAAAAGVRRKNATRLNGAWFRLDDADGAAPEAPAAVEFVCPMGLLQIQEATDPEPSGARAALRRGSDLLDRLDDLRLALLSGAIPPLRLRALSDALAAKKTESEDPRLDEIIAEIELRAAVELAKHDRTRRADAPKTAAAETFYRSFSET